jgi:phosphatidylglycerol lysyltransferase
MATADLILQEQDQFAHGEKAVSRATTDIRLILVRLVALITLGSGLLNLYSIVALRFPQRIAALEDIFPLGFIHLSRFLTMLIGFALIISSISIYRRKLRAFQGVLALSCLAVIFHLTRGLHYEEATLSLILVVVLLFTRKYFNVKSSIQTLPMALLRAGIAFIIALSYGSVGFWFLEGRHFQYNFHWNDAITEAFRYILLIGDPSLVAYTQHAAWFIDSLYLMSFTAIAYAIFALYRPMMYKYRSHPRELAQAREIIEKYGHNAMDYFKYWPDKSLFFSKPGNSVIAYRVGNNIAVVLGDPVGPKNEVEQLMRDFITLCGQNDWGVAFHQASSDYLSIYDRLGLRKIKVGDDAIVDLTSFTLEGKAHKSLRQAVNRVEELGVRFEIYEPPLSDEIIAEAQGISDQWMTLPGHRERRFTLGLFEKNYLKSTPLAFAIDCDGKPLAFVNLIPSYFPGEATNDLMRRIPDSPNGIMDFLFIKLFLSLQQKGFSRFNMGMAPMSGFQKGEIPTAEEKAIHYFFQHLNFLFRYSGLKSFKAKFASSWEPRYAIYKNALDLPRLALALREISEVEK